jgi:hypothetical protein
MHWREFLSIRRRVACVAGSQHLEGIVVEIFDDQRVDGAGLGARGTDVGDCILALRQ